MLFKTPTNKSFSMFQVFCQPLEDFSELEVTKRGLSDPNDPRLGKGVLNRLKIWLLQSVFL